MDCNLSSKMEDSRISSLRRMKTSEKETEAEDCAAKQVPDSHDNLTTRQKAFAKNGLPLEKKMEQEQRRRHVLINEHNRLTFAVKEKEAKLKELQESLKTKNLHPTNYKSEDTCKQRIRQLENNLENMKTKITEAKKIQTTYQLIHEHLQQEVRGMFKVLDQKERAVAFGQAEVVKANKQFQSAAAAADSTLGKMAQMEYETTGKKREMDIKLCELSAEEKELKRQLETLGFHSPTGQSKLTEQEIEEEEAHLIPVTDHQYYDICGASQSDMKLVEDMEMLRQALGCAEVQDLVNKVVSQQANKEQLLAEVTQHEELTRQEAKTLADLELQYAEFSAKPAATRFDKLKGQMQVMVNQEVDHVQRLQAELKQSQDLLDAVEQGVNNLYFRMSCVPVEGLPSTSSTDSTDKLRDISARLPTLLQRASEQKPDVSGLDQERFAGTAQWDGVRAHQETSQPSDTPHLTDDEEECPSSDKEINAAALD